MNWNKIKRYLEENPALGAACIGGIYLIAAHVFMFLPIIGMSLYVPIFLSDWILCAASGHEVPCLGGNGLMDYVFGMAVTFLLVSLVAFVILRKRQKK